MPKADKTSVVSTQTDSHIRGLLLAGLTGASPTTGIATSHSPMMRTSIAAALAVLPGEDDSPRVIRQFTSVFLVSRAGELWRVYDVDDPQSADRQMPSPTSQLAWRVFMALARDEQVRVHRFGERESRELDPIVLQQQLDAAERIEHGH
jgi:hypothetical protein